MIHFEEGQTVLFIGDSITDCGRSRENPQILGGGYAMMTAAKLAKNYPEFNLRFVNTGISGNRVKDLESRWTEDCIDLKPDILSILIGINDTWRRYDSNDPTDARIFGKDYRSILERARDELSCQIVIIEPFVLPVPDDRKKWHEDLAPKIAVTRELALEFADAYVPLDGLFAAACCRQKPSYWAGDGVHPTLAGHMFIADAWIEAAGV